MSGYHLSTSGYGVATPENYVEVEQCISIYWWGWGSLISYNLYLYLLTIPSHRLFHHIYKLRFALIVI
jgi:hypothetical protein